MEALFLIFNLPSSFITGYLLGGEWILLPLVVLYVVSPLLDVIVISYFPSINSKNFFKSNYSGVIDNALKIYPFVQLTMFILLMLKYHTYSFTSSEYWLTAISFGCVCGGTGLMIGHELFHRKDKISSIGGIILTGMASYTHWIIEHIHGHHKNVGTPQDPCTARRGESLYKFFVRSITWQYTSAYRINKVRFFKLKAIEFSFYGVVLFFFGLQGLVFVLVQSIVAALLLENVNYIEHYGLTRTKLPSGKYSKVTSEHSWDSYSILTNISLLNLGFHADHHANVNKKFMDLEAKSSNAIPYGIPAQLVLSLVPSLWYSIMDPKLDNEYINIEEASQALGTYPV